MTENDILQQAEKLEDLSRRLEKAFEKLLKDLELKD